MARKNGQGRPQSLTEPAEPCVWMSAGLVTYKLCDREFECESCPLDAALSGAKPGDRGAKLPPVGRRPTPDFPEDRRYGLGHTWVSSVGERRLRIGLAPFAVGLIGPIHGVASVRMGAQLEKGAVACTLEARFGPVPVSMPVAGRVERINAMLIAEPSLLGQDPYRDGWLLEVVVPDADAIPRDETLLTADAIRVQSRLDVRRFRRRLGAYLLLDEGGPREDLGPVMADGGERLTDLSLILGESRYRDLVLDLLG